jgi:hypothetical protein
MRGSEEAGVCTRPIAHCKLQIPNCESGYLPPAACCLPPAACRLLPAARRLLPAARCLPPAACQQPTKEIDP